MRHIFRTTVSLYVSGHETEHDCNVSYIHHRADGDGWNEPRTTACAEVVRVEVISDVGLPVDLLSLGLISDKAQGELEAECLADYIESMEPDPDYLRDREYDNSY